MEIIWNNNTTEVLITERKDSGMPVHQHASYSMKYVRSLLSNIGANVIAIPHLSVIEIFLLKKGLQSDDRIEDSIELSISSAYRWGG